MNEQDVLLSLREQKKSLRREIKASSKRMNDVMHEIFAPVPEAKDKAQGFSHLVSNGLAVWQGVRIGMSLITAARSFFGHRNVARI